jgi:hypothetical protein
VIWEKSSQFANFLSWGWSEVEEAGRKRMNRLHKDERSVATGGEESTNVGQIKKGDRSNERSPSSIYGDGMLCPVAGYPMFVIIAGGPVTGNPARSIGMRHITGTEACGDYQRKNAQLDGAENALFCGVRFHDFKFNSRIAADRRGLTVFYR